MNKSWIIIALVCVVGLVFWFGIPSEVLVNANFSSDAPYVYLVYSSSCSHCHSLIEYVESTGVEVNLVKTKDFPPIAEFLSDY